MTAPLDEKGLEAAINVACRNAGHDPNACMFGSGGTSVGSECHVTYREAHRAGTAQVIRAYLSTVALPDELEVVAWLKEQANDAEADGLHRTAAMFDQAIATLSSAHSIIAALRAERDRFRDMADGYGKLDADLAIAEAQLEEAVSCLKEEQRTRYLSDGSSFEAARKTEQFLTSFGEKQDAE